MLTLNAVTAMQQHGHSAFNSVNPDRVDHMVNEAADEMTLEEFSSWLERHMRR